MHNLKTRKLEYLCILHSLHQQHEKNIDVVVTTGNNKHTYIKITILFTYVCIYKLHDTDLCHNIKTKHLCLALSIPIQCFQRFCF